MLYSRDTNMHMVIVGCGNVGLAVASALFESSHGASLLMLDQLRPKRFAEIEDLARSKSQTVRFEQVDATNIQEMSRVMREHCSTGVNTLVCTVGTSSNATLLTDPDGFWRCFDTNIFGVIAPIKATLPYLKGDGERRIVVLSSTSAYQAPPDLCAYTSSKWALTNLAGALRSELGPQGIRVDIYFPSNIRNRDSAIFDFSRGIDPMTVGRHIIEDGWRHTRGADHSLPFWYRGVVRSGERLMPRLQDWRFGLRHHQARRSRYRLMRLETALITGASSGLGRELALAYSTHVKRLHLTARNTDRLADLKAVIEASTTCEVFTHQLDLRDPESIHDLIKRSGPVDLLINNAGNMTYGSVEEMSVDSMREIFRANFFGPALLTERYLQLETTRKVISILSTTAIAGRRGHGAYSASKAALWCFTRSLRRTHGAVNILEVLPATFFVANSSACRSHGLLAARRLNARDVASKIREAEATGREQIFLPKEAKAFLALECLAPSLFRRLYP